ncbi:hypothetical protein HHI36_018360 [Cryptolaemus montrouzieri]|uniref:L-aminoadipate-semialdehyde dehydrogenase-phosphopantetheinyl transferase n=1 Tax=Cryptolaemus montrouzieri TaxID=559131 RepID=A0ABD2P052_9CUCU
MKMAEKNIRWAFNISKWNPSRDEIVRCTTYVQPEEKERLGRFIFKNDFKSSLIGRLLMRKFVAEASESLYNEILFSRNDKGKPILVNPSFEALKFNVSHQGDYVVLVGSNNNNFLGVDVMKMEYKGGKKLSEFFRLMTRQFSNYEWETIKLGSEYEQIRMFYRHWCLKESYVKAVGVGITVDLQNISFKVIEKKLGLNEILKSTQLFLNGQKQNWEFHEMLLDENHCVAVGIEGLGNEEIFFKELNINELIGNGVPITIEDSEFCDSYYEKLDR